MDYSYQIELYNRGINMMQCQICGDQQGPWEYEEYKSANKKPWLIENGQIVLVCEKCAKILRKRMKKERELK